MNELLIYCDFVTERLRYTLQFICTERKVNFKLCNDRHRFFQQTGCAKLVYADYPFDEPFPKIVPANLIFEDVIRKQELSKMEFADSQCLGFDNLADPIASIFYVTSRYEEYLPFPEDEHQRFPSFCSIQHKFSWLHQPIADIWAECILEYIKSSYPDFVYTKPQSKLLLSFDIDNTFAFKHKNVVQLYGGRLKDFLKGNQQNSALRSQVLNGSAKDPNDTFDQIFTYANNGVKTRIFWHLGDFKKFDRNIAWTNAVHQRLIQKMASKISIGIHPSYASYLNESSVKQERGRLEHILKKPVFHSRQHFLKIRFPNTFQLLHNITIKHDYSIGFADDVGFRLGTARPIQFYNLNTDEVTDLVLHPFIYMDGTLNQYLKLSPEEAVILISRLINEVKIHGGDFVCIWHNDTINDLGIWKGWRSVLEFTIQQFQES